MIRFSGSLPLTSLLAGEVDARRAAGEGGFAKVASTVPLSRPKRVTQRFPSHPDASRPTSPSRGEVKLCLSYQVKDRPEAADQGGSVGIASTASRGTRPRDYCVFPLTRSLTRAASPIGEEQREQPRAHHRSHRSEGLDAKHPDEGGSARLISTARSCAPQRRKGGSLFARAFARAVPLSRVEVKRCFSLSGRDQNVGGKP